MDKGSKKEVVSLACERTGSRTFSDIVAKKKIQRRNFLATVALFFQASVLEGIAACIVIAIIKYCYFSYISVLSSQEE